MATYVNDLRLKEIATGDESGTWGASTNTNLELIGDAFGYGTEAITTNADTHTTTIADGSADAGRAMFLKYTGTLDSACTITIGPNTVSKLWFIENGTSGSQNIIISQGSGANVTIPNGQVKVIYSDGAGSGAAMVDAFASLALTLATAAQPNVTSLGTLTTLTVDDITINGSTISDASDLTLDAGGDIILDADGADIILKDGGTSVANITLTAGNLILNCLVSDEDFLVKGNDGGSTVDALFLDMSDAGTAYFNHDARVYDNGKFIAGTGSDLEIYHDGSHSYVSDVGTGGLKITGGDIYIRNPSDADMIHATSGGAVNLYHNGSAKLATTSTGATTTGLHTSTQSANITQVAITSSSNAVAWDARAAANAYHVTTENTTFSAPSNAVEGAIISVEIAQGGTARTIAWNTVFEFASSTAPTITATANKTDILSFRYNGSVWQEIGRVQNLAQT